MKKIPSLFVRDQETKRLTLEVLPGSEWVIAGEGVPTYKWDGTACMIRSGRLFKRYARKRNRKTGEHKPAPEGWEACQEPDPITGHWPGWVPVGDSPEDRWHRAAAGQDQEDGTYELVGPKINGDPHALEEDHLLWVHGAPLAEDMPLPITFSTLGLFLSTFEIAEGIVWHHPDGRMVKIKRRDFGHPWPLIKGPKGQDPSRRGVMVVGPVRT